MRDRVELPKFHDEYPVNSLAHMDSVRPKSAKMDNRILVS